jgi:beta-galactosidase
LTPASVTISVKAVKLRPQAAVWEREVPAGSGITGLWRPAPVAAAAGRGGGGFGGGATQVFTFRQNGNAIAGTVEGGGGFGRGGGSGDAPIAIEDGKVDGANISFSAAGVTYTGTLKGDAIELQRTGGAMGGRGGRGAPAEPAGLRPAIGPPPDGSDPSNGFFIAGRAAGRGAPTPAPMLLHRATR